MYRADWLVQLACPGHRRTLGRLCHGCHDTSWRLYRLSRLCPAELSSFPPFDTHHAYPRMYQQYADEVDCQLQLRWVYVQYHRVVYCSHLDSCGDE